MNIAWELMWAIAAVGSLGCGLGTWIQRVSRLPAWTWLPLVGMAACFTSYLLFFVSFFSPWAGRLGVRLWVPMDVVLFVWCCRHADTRERLQHRDTWLPVLLTVVLTASYLASVAAVPVTTINQRFRYELPPDNILPWIVADHVSNGLYGIAVPPLPLDSDWRSSDRPPLQAAIALAAFATHKGEHSLFYRCVATLCQMGWVGAIYALGRAMSLSRRSQQIALLVAASSGFFFFNAVYTWPKLLSAWLFLMGLTLVLWIVRERERASMWIAPLAIAGIALSLLAHGGIAFSVLALPWLIARWRLWQLIRLRSAIAAGIVAVGLLGPWMLYQRFYDPPGNRLLKMHLAGVPDIDARSTTQALIETYRSLSWREYAQGRWANIRQQWFGTYPLPRENWIDWVQWQQLMHHIPLIGFLCVGYALLFVRPSSHRLSDDSLRLTREFAWFALMTMAIWIVIMIVPSSTLIHQGSYAMTTLLLFCGAVFVSALPATLRYLLVNLHLLLFAVCYLFSTRVAERGPVTARPGLFAIAAVLFAAFVGLLHLLPMESDTSPARISGARDTYSAHPASAPR